MRKIAAAAAATSKTAAILAIGIIVLATIYIAYRYEFSPNALVIVEPRQHELLKYVIDNFDATIDKSWDLYVFHGKTSQAYAKYATESVKGRKVFLIPLQTDNLNAAQYNELFKSADFWSQVWAENILVFQTDTSICKGSKFKISDFMKYDYIGCAGGKDDYGKGAYWGGDEKKYSFYGVGGLSFRKKSFMNKCIAARPGIKPSYAEDVFFSECLEYFGVKPESAEVLNNFCSQNSFHAESFGAHKTKNMRRDDKKRFHTYCPVSQALEVA